MSGCIYHDLYLKFLYQDPDTDELVYQSYHQAQHATQTDPLGEVRLAPEVEEPGKQSDPVCPMCYKNIPQHLWLSHNRRCSGKRVNGWGSG